MTISVGNGTWWAVVALIAAAALGVWRLRGRPPGRDNRRFLAGLGAFTLGYLAVYKTLLAFVPGFDFSLWNELPLQPCMAIYLTLRWLLRRKRPRIRWSVQYGTALFALLWHAGINAYDLLRDPAADTTIFATALLGLAVFIQMPVVYSLVAYGLSYGLFILLAGGILSSGNLINLTFTAIVALAVSMTSFRHSVVTIGQRRKIDQMNQRLQELAQRDSLTGLMNTAAFRKRVESHLAAVKAGAETLLLILDLDNFKGINDAFGHPCGDYVLQEAAIKLRALFPRAVGAARIGGDEFMLALAGASPQEIEGCFTQLLGEMGQLGWHGQTLHAGCSMGVCRVSGPGATYDELYNAADQALYQAKRQGKGQFVCSELSHTG